MAKFADLPLEIREAIWELCLPGPNLGKRGIYFFDPKDFILADNLTGSALASNYNRQVITAFPRIMHVCRESRDSAKRHLSFRREQISADHWLDLPCRRYQPNKDIFFILPSRIKEFDMALKATELVTEPTGEDGQHHFYQEIHYLAFGGHHFRTICDEFYEFVSGMSNLWQLSVVLGPCWKDDPNLELDSQNGDGGGKPDNEKIDPIKRFGLERPQSDDEIYKKYSYAWVDRLLQGLEIGLDLFPYGREGEPPVDEETGARLFQGFEANVMKMVQLPGII